MTLMPATFFLPKLDTVSEPFRPGMDHQSRLEDYDYVEEEWFATGEGDSRPYTTTVLVRRP
jgi:Alpha/beta hydrolase domain